MISSEASNLLLQEPLEI